MLQYSIIALSIDASWLSSTSGNFLILATCVKASAMNTTLCDPQNM